MKTILETKNLSKIFKSKIYFLSFAVTDVNISYENETLLLAKMWKIYKQECWLDYQTFEWYN